MRQTPRFVVPGLLGMTLGTVWGCGTSEVPVFSVTQAGMDAGVDAHIGVDAQVPVDATVPPTLDGGPPIMTQDFCSQTGPPMLVGTTDAGVCPDQLAQNAFRYALCTCNNYTSTNALTTDAFDGSQGAYDPSKATPGGSVGVNGLFHPQGLMTIGGSLWASDMMPTFTTSILHVDGDLHIAQAELQPTTLVVQGDAWLGGGIQTTGNVTIGGTMHVPATAPTSVSGMLMTGGVDTMSLAYAPACNCDKSSFVDVAGVVRAYEAQNDDMALGIHATDFENVSTSTTKMLSCGRYYLTRIGGTGSIVLTAMGHVAVFVGGDLSPTGDFKIDVPPGSELDLFVAGSLTPGGAFLVGDQSNPARARTYVGGPTVNLQKTTTLAGNLYAPQATVNLGSMAATTLYGSVFAWSFNATSDLTIHYDKAILSPTLAPTCSSPMQCTTCNDCNGQACNSNTCAKCADSSQCCAPLVCDTQSGQCVASVTPP